MIQPQIFQIIHKNALPLEGDFPFRKFYHFANRMELLPSGGEQVLTKASSPWKRNLNADLPVEGVWLKIGLGTKWNNRRP